MVVAGSIRKQIFLHAGYCIFQKSNCIDFLVTLILYMYIFNELYLMHLQFRIHFGEEFVNVLLLEV